MAKGNVRPFHEGECLEQPEGWPCICDSIHEQEDDAYTDSLIEDALTEDLSDIPGISRDMIDTGL